MFPRWVYSFSRVMEFVMKYRDCLCLKVVGICLSITRDGPKFGDMFHTQRVSWKDIYM